MFEMLPASALRENSSAGPSVVAAAMHGALIVSAVMLARPILEAATGAQPIDVWIPFPIAESPRAPAGTSSTVAQPFAAPLDIPPVIVPPLPTDLPLLPLQSRLDRLTDRIAAPGIGGEHGVGANDSLSGASGVWTAMMVDEPASVAEVVRPQYPRTLEAAGVTGRVVLEFVIDTSGRVEPASVRIVSSSHLYGDRKSVV